MKLGTKYPTQELTLLKGFKVKGQGDNQTDEPTDDTVTG